MDGVAHRSRGPGGLGPARAGPVSLAGISTLLGVSGFVMAGA